MEKPAKNRRKIGAKFSRAKTAISDFGILARGRYRGAAPRGARVRKQTKERGATAALVRITKKNPEAAPVFFGVRSRGVGK
jgi:hypothetical protein